MIFQKYFLKLLPLAIVILGQIPSLAAMEMDTLQYLIILMFAVLYGCIVHALKIIVKGHCCHDISFLLFCINWCRHVLSNLL